jgi:hypothetical protein
MTLVCLGVGIAFLVFLSLIPLFPMMSMSVSMRMGGVAVDSQSQSSPSLFSDNWHGKVLLIVGLVVSLVAIGGLVLCLMMPPRTAELFVTVSSCIGGAWGILALVWLAGWVWKVLKASQQVKEMMGIRGGGEVDLSVGPSFGMWTGLAVALLVAAAFSTLMSLRGKTLWLYIAEGVGLLLGVLLLVVAVKPWEGGGIGAPPGPGRFGAPRGNPFGMHHARPAHPGPGQLSASAAAAPRLG